MKPKIIFPLIIVATIIASLQCHKHKDQLPSQLPPITQEGKNTIGFTLNGEVWVPYAKCAFFSNPCREISASYGTAGGASPNGIGFSFFRVRNGKESSLIISSPFATITFPGEKVDSIGATFLSEDMNGNNGYFIGPIVGSKFYITRLDSSAQIISGEFDLILLEQNGSGRTIELKDGRFDFKFNACKCSN